MKKLDIASYPDGYNVSNIRCEYLTLATYISVYDKKFYHKFSFLYACINNWNINNIKEDEQVIPAILEKLGLGLKEVIVHNKEELLEQIKRVIDKGISLLTPVKYNSLFYYKNYKNEEEKGRTLLIINGYDETNRLYNIMDMTIGRSTLSSYFKGEIFLPLQIEEGMLENIIRDSSEQKDELGYKGRLRYIEPLENVTPISESELMEFLIMCFDNKKDRLIGVLEQYGELAKYGRVPEGFDLWLIKQFVSPMTMISDFIKQYCKNRHISVDDIALSMDELVKTRKLVVNKLLKLHMKETLFQKELEEELIQKLTSQSKKVVEKLRGIADNKAIYDEGNEANNLLDDAVLSADSELRSLKFILNKNKTGQNEHWVSYARGNVHWINMEWKELKKVSKISIYHYESPELCTREYKLLVSNDGIEWETKVYADANDQYKTTHYFEDVECKFIKLEILQPNKVDNYARIKEIFVE